MLRARASPAQSIPGGRQAQAGRQARSAVGRGAKPPSEGSPPPRCGSISGTASVAARRSRMAIEPGKIRNIGVVGHGGVGKTSLVEALLFTAGAVTRLGR